MLGIAPAGAMASDVPCGTFLEGHRLGSVEAPLQPFGPPRIDGINAIMPLQSEPGRSAPRLGKSNGVKRSHPHPAGSAIQHEPENPVLGAALGHSQVETAAIGVHAGMICLIDLESRQPSNGSPHCLVNTCPRISPQSYRGLWRTGANVSRQKRLGIRAFLGDS